MIGIILLTLLTWQQCLLNHTHWFIFSPAFYSKDNHRNSKSVILMLLSKALSSYPWKGKLLSLLALFQTYVFILLSSIWPQQKPVSCVAVNQTFKEKLGHSFKHFRDNLKGKETTILVPTTTATQTSWDHIFLLYKMHWRKDKSFHYRHHWSF